MFLESGDLLELFPDFKGEWEIDKYLFMDYCEEMDELLFNSGLEDDLDEDECF